jgi:hypothetical protein
MSATRRAMATDERQEMRPIDREFVDGYFDGHDTDTPEPGANRSAAYRHSFEIGRREKEGRDPIPAAISREKARRIMIDDGSCPKLGCLGYLDARLADRVCLSCGTCSE